MRTILLDTVGLLALWEKRSAVVLPPPTQRATPAPFPLHDKPRSGAPQENSPNRQVGFP